jgi:spermidine synthase
VRWWFLFFLGSGFAGLVYEVVWLRLTMASFGVTTPLVSIVLSVFMGGIALGSFAVGRFARRLEARRDRALALYATTEAAIAVGALLVPFVLRLGHMLLTASGATFAWDSVSYYLASFAWIAITLLPPCTAMGATFPLAMVAIRAEHRDAETRSFSFLYVANVLGATCGTLVSAFVLIELFGFRATLAVAAAINLLVAIGAFVRSSRRRALASASASVAAAVSHDRRASRGMLAALFLTGLVSMAMEVVWIRQFTPYLGNLVYAFAAILATYLAGTFLGSRLYRQWPDASTRVVGLLWLGAGLTGLLALVTADPRLSIAPATRLLIGVAPFTALVGLITPKLVDRWSAGDADRAGAAYAMNVVGSIAGPLVAGFWLLPTIGEHASIAVLTLPLFVAGAIGAMRADLVGGDGARSRWQIAAVAAGVLIAVALVTSTKSFETLYPERVVRRDHTATVVATGSGMQKDLLVNGIPMTSMTAITKWMAHLPLAFLDHRPTDALVICFGMGTTFRSMLSWDVRTTAVDLVPSVPAMFPYYHDDAAALLRSPNARIVIDDGRRFLERSHESYDVITIDPPNPPEAAGSSLLYSREFYAIASAHLRSGGILQQWIPGSDFGTVASVSRALDESFPYVRTFAVINRRPPRIQVLGVHYLASNQPIPRRSADELARRLPDAAVRDLLEWPFAPTAEKLFALLLAREVPLDELIALRRSAPALVDDRPFNEYFLLRRWMLARSAPPI